MQKNKNQDSHPQSQTVPTDNNQKPKKKLINKKRIVPLLINFPFMFQISDSLFRAMESQNLKEFKDPSRTSQVFYSKTLRSVSFQDQNTVLKFRTIKQKFESIETYLELFKSSGDEYFYDIAVSYQFAYNQYNMFNRLQTQNVKNTTHHQVIEDSLTRIKGKKYLAYFIENIQDQTCLSKIIISNQLLQATGYKKEELQLDFIKYRLYKIQTQFFKKIYIQLGHYVKKIIQKTTEITIIDQDNPHKKNLIVFNDFVYRKNVYESEQQVDQKLNAVIQFYKPHQKITMFEFQIDQEHVLSTVPRQKVTLQKQKFDKIIEKQERKSLQHILDNIVQVQSIQ